MNTSISLKKQVFSFDNYIFNIQLLFSDTQTFRFPLFYYSSCYLRVGRTLEQHLTEGGPGTQYGKKKKEKK